MPVRETRPVDQIGDAAVHPRNPYRLVKTRDDLALIRQKPEFKLYHRHRTDGKPPAVGG